MRPIRVVADASIPYLKQGMPLPYEGVEAFYLPANEITRQTLCELRADALMIRSITPCRSDLLHDTAVKLITTATAGADHIDQAYCQGAGITWHNAPGCNAGGVVQYTLAAICKFALAHHWDLSTVTVGIVGVGHVGNKLHQALQAWGISTLLVDPPRAKRGDNLPFASLEEVAQTCQIITLHVPLTTQGVDATYHLVDRTFLQQCAAQKPLLINAARGGITDTQALKEALRQQWIAGAVIDCWEYEPHIDTELLSQTFQATPHIAGFSAEGKARGTATSLQHLAQYFSVPLNRLDAVQAPPPPQPVINAHAFTSGREIEQAILSTVSLQQVEHGLRNHQPFEQLRQAYHRPNEMQAYSVCGITSVATQNTLRQLGFHIIS